MRFLFALVSTLIIFSAANSVSALTLDNAISQVESPFYMGMLSGNVNFQIDVDTSPNYLWGTTLEIKCAGGMSEQHDGNSLEESEYTILERAEIASYCVLNQLNQDYRPYDELNDGDLTEYPKFNGSRMQSIQRGGTDLYEVVDNQLNRIATLPNDNDYYVIDSDSYYTCTNKIYHFNDTSGISFHDPRECKIRFTACDTGSASNKVGISAVASAPGECKTIEREMVAQQLSGFGFIGVGGWVTLVLVVILSFTAIKRFRFSNKQAP
jgi:hypothetical protein